MLRYVLIVIGLLAVMAGFAFLIYYKKQELLAAFGITPATKDPADGGQQKFEMSQSQAQAQAQAQAPTNAAAIPPGVRAPTPPETGANPAPAAPMIVIEASSANQGELMSYDQLKRACGNWAALQVIGEGAAAIVYRAEIPRFGNVAVKRFCKDTESMGWNFDRELEALSQCRHPHVLEILGRTQTGSERLMVMPLMEGGPLASCIFRMPWEYRAVVFGQIVRAVSFLHGKKMIHRDIKSSNILLDRTLRHARVADFGLAKDQVRGSRTHGTTGIVVGSPGYMAPELMMRPANEKTDSYALGVVLLEVLTGLPAWDVNRGEGVGLTDFAVEEMMFKESLADAKAKWPAEEVQILGAQAVKLTLFDPGARKVATDIESGAEYKGHLQRADIAMNGTGPSTIGAAA